MPAEHPAEVWHVDKFVSDDATLMQGDLLRFGQTDSFTYGVVVTADCDLDKKKHSKIVTYVPLVSDVDAIRESLIHDLISRRDADCRKILAKRFSLDFSSEISFETQLIIKLSARDLLAQDAMLGAVEKEDLLALLYCGRYPCPTYEQCKGVALLLKLEWDKATEFFRNQLATRGDFLALSCPPLIEEGVFIAWLRGVKQCQISSIALRTSEERDSEKAALRIGRLRSPYIYRLTQMLGQVFSDIGLPDLPKITEIAKG